MFKRVLFRLFGALTIILILMPFQMALAQGGNVRVTVDALVDDQFPQMDLYLSALDVKGFPILDLQAEHLTITEDGQPVTGFQLTPIHSASTPMVVALALDTSDSMQARSKPNGVPALENSVKAAKVFVSDLPATDQVALLQFQGDVTTVQDLTQDKTLITTGLETLKPKGATALYDAIQKSVELLKNRPEKRAIVVLTDGKDEGSTATMEQAIQSAKDASIPIYLIGFGKVEQGKLEQIAQETGGSVQIKPDSTQLDAAFQAIQRTFREQYRIQYPSGLKADGNQHNLSLKMLYQGWIAQKDITFSAKMSQVGVTLPDIQDGSIVGGFVKLAPLFSTPAQQVLAMNLLLDSSPFDTVPAAPFEYTWDTSKVPPGTHTLTISATDISGNSGEMSMQLNIRPAVLVAINNPAADSEVRGVNTIEVQVDLLAQVGTVEVFANDKSIGTIPPSSASPTTYSIDWNTADFTPGANNLKAVVTDVNGLQGETTIPIVVVVQNQTWVLAVALGLGLVLLAVLVPTGIRKRKKIARAAEQGLAGSSDMAGPALAGPQPEATLREIQGVSPGNGWPLQASEIHLGRKRDENDIPLQGLSASRRHAVMQRANGGWKIISLNPDNPVMVNGNPVQEKILQPGDTIQMGDSVFQFE